MESTHSKSVLSGKLIVVADDLGLDESINEGIFFAFKEGLIDWASLMVNGQAFDHAVAGIKTTPGLKVGIHLVLVEEKSILLRSEIPSLLNHKGLFYRSHRIFFILYILGLVKHDELKKEIEAQIKKVLEMGIKPQFINSHQHLHLLPGIMDIIISMAQKYNIPYIRIVNEPLEASGSLFRKVQLCFLKFLSFWAKNKIIKNGLQCNDLFVGFLHAGNLSKSDIDFARRLNHKYPEKIIELGCHPGFENPYLTTRYKKWGYHWQYEIEVLKSLFR